MESPPTPAGYFYFRGDVMYYRYDYNRYYENDCERCLSVIDPEQYHHNRGLCDKCIAQLKSEIEEAKEYYIKNCNNLF